MDFFKYITVENIARLLWVAGALYILMKFIKAIRIVPQRKEFIVERLGRYHKTLKPGFHTLIPFIDNVSFIQDLREKTIDVPPQECFTKDNVQVEVDGVIYIRVLDSEKASYGITDYRTGAIQLAQTTVRSVIGTIELDTTFEERDLINERILEALSNASEPWGIQVHRYEVRNIVPPDTVTHAMEQQMTAERERRAMIAQAEGVYGSKLNSSEGKKAELINTSEGDMERRINEAQGHAREIEDVAEATAQAIARLANAVNGKGGAEAVKLQLSERYLKNLRELAYSETSVIFPANLTKLDNLLGSLGLGPDKKGKL
jgi:regulator of protease activity HflC (stomatin/prohibitin superfamily)